MASFVPLSTNTGFDPPSAESSHPWQAVFKDETTLVRLIGGASCEVVLEPSGTTDVEMTGNALSRDGSRIHRLKGLKSGAHVTVVAWKPGATGPSPTDARLEIDVMEPGSQRVRFYRLIDSGGHQARRTTASTKQLLLDTAVIHSLQDGVFLNFQGAQDLILDADLGRIVFSTTAFNHLDGLFRSGALSLCQADFHVFLVWSVEGDMRNVRSGVQSTLAVTRGNLCLLEDSSGPAGPTLAHEVGHYLQEPSVTGDGHHGSGGNLMFKNTPNGAHLDRRQCVIMNANAQNGRLLRDACQVPVP